MMKLMMMKVMMMVMVWLGMAWHGMVWHGIMGELQGGVGKAQGSGDGGCVSMCREKKNIFFLSIIKFST